MHENNSGYRIVEVLREEDGAVAVITEKAENGRMSVMFCREFDRGGKVERSPYVAIRHLSGLRKLIEKAELKLEELEDRARARRRIETEYVEPSLKAS